MNIAEYSIRHKVVSWLFTLILLVGGAISFTRLGQLEWAPQQPRQSTP